MSEKKTRHNDKEINKHTNTNKYTQKINSFTKSRRLGVLSLQWKWIHWSCPGGTPWRRHPSPPVTLRVLLLKEFQILAPMFLKLFLWARGINNLLLLTDLNPNEHISSEYLNMSDIYWGAKLLKDLNKSVAWWNSMFLSIGCQLSVLKSCTDGTE